MVAIVVVKAFVHYISRHGFAPFAWYRIVAGAVALVWLIDALIFATALRCAKSFRDLEGDR